MRIYAAYLFVIVALLAVSVVQAEGLVQPSSEHFVEHFHHVMALKFS